MRNIGDSTRYQWMRYYAGNYAAFNVLTDVPSLKAWYRADTTVNGGGTVSQLTDKSGNGFHLTQATGTKQPALNVADANMGGRNSITFDGVDDALGMVSPGYGALNALTTIWVIRSLPTPAATGRLFSLGDVSPQSASSLMNTNGNLQFRYSNPGSTFTTWGLGTSEGAAISLAKPTILACAQSVQTNVAAGRSRLGSVGSQSATSATASTIVAAAFGIGAQANGLSVYLNFTFAELIICSAVLTADQMRKVELYLAGYYGLL